SPDLVRRDREELIARRQRVARLSEQARVLDRQRRPSSELLDRRQIRGRVRTTVRGGQRDRPGQLALGEQGNTQVRSVPDLVDERVLGQDGGVQVGGKRPPPVARDGREPPRIPVAKQIDRTAFRKILNREVSDAGQRFFDL